VGKFRQGNWHSWERTTDNAGVKMQQLGEWEES
jgi:hypothetical protein